MSRIAKSVIGIALLFYVASYAASRTGKYLNPDPFFGSVDIWQWTAWDYTSLALLLVALGLTFAAVLLRKK